MSSRWVWTMALAVISYAIYTFSCSDFVAANRKTCAHSFTALNDVRDSKWLWCRRRRRGEISIEKFSFVLSTQHKHLRQDKQMMQSTATYVRWQATMEKRHWHWGKTHLILYRWRRRLPARRFECTYSSAKLVYYFKNLIKQNLNNIFQQCQHKQTRNLASDFWKFSFFFFRK